MPKGALAKLIFLRIPEGMFILYTAYFILPWFHHPPVNSGGVTNTGTLCMYRMGKASKLQGRSKTFHHVHFQMYVFMFSIYYRSKLGIPEWFIQLSIS